jgi:predicted O-linked N-acetylglucosamine transferase (SPINDLY family)
LNFLHRRSELASAIDTEPAIDRLRLLAETAAKGGDADTACRLWAQVIALRPDDASAYYKHANSLKNLGQPVAALAQYDQAIALDPLYAIAFCNRGAVLEQLGRLEDAVASYRRALSLAPEDALSHYNHGTALRKLGRPREALQSLDAAIAIGPNQARAHFNRGILLKELGKPTEALADFDRAVTLDPGFGEAYFNRGLLLMARKQTAAALIDFDKAIEVNPQLVEAHFARAELLVQTRHPAEAVESYDRALLLAPQTHYLLGNRLYAKMCAGDWRELETDIERLRANIADDSTRTVLLPLLALTDDPALHARAARAWVSAEYPPDRSLPAIERTIRTPRIRVGYFSPDFGNHPVSLLAAELFEIHDRTRFEVTAFSFNADTKDPMRVRLERAFDRFIDVSGMTDEEVAKRARSMNLDIAVDLAGHTGEARTGIFALRAAPVQINYLGYLGTMGADYMDYLVADRTVITSESEACFTEKIIYLPDTFQVNDRKREISSRIFRREELGLPTRGFVFCCFNSTYKILPATFGVWMRILTRVPGSVLLLIGGRDALEGNLRAQAAHHGVDPRRLVFAERLPPPEYLARYRAADLFLDTLPYNAGATASDALWAGLPVLTCLGKAFAGRVAASLLKAVDLPELITSSPAQYEELAVALATDPVRLADLRARLEKNRLTSPLFDTQKFTLALEAAYTRVRERALAGLGPENLDV